MVRGASKTTGRCVHLRNVTLSVNLVQAHDAPISKVCWAHPEYGTIIASSSFDRTVKIWEKAGSSTNLDATISSDNHLLIYDCLEPSALTSWQLTEEVDVTSLPTSPSPSYFSRSHTLAVATPTQTSAMLDSASATQVAQALQQNLQQGSSQPRPGSGNKEADGGWCISWCKDRYWGEVLAVGCGTSGIIKVRRLQRLYHIT